jgi:DNA-directed RNA polymerase specialized sigma24 family protein
MFGRPPAETATAEDARFAESATAQLPALRRLAHRLCGDPRRADDIVQIGLTRLYTRVAQIVLSAPMRQATAQFGSSWR